MLFTSSYLLLHERNDRFLTPDEHYQNNYASDITVTTRLERLPTCHQLENVHNCCAHYLTNNRRSLDSCPKNSTCFAEESSKSLYCECNNCSCLREPEPCIYCCSNLCFHHKSLASDFSQIRSFFDSTNSRLLRGISPKINNDFYTKLASIRCNHISPLGRIILVRNHRGLTQQR